MSAVAKVEAHLPDNVVPARSMMEIIARAASDPNTDVEKLERLMAMAERIEEKKAKTAYFAALSPMQEELPEIEERGEIKISDNKPGQGYARWEDINKAIKPVLKKHGFALSFRTGLADGKITVTGILSHEAGHSEETTMHLPADTSGSKNAVQAVGSSTSYGKRYTAAALLNITTRGGDDDGRAAGGNAPISEEQAERILDMLTKDKADVPGFCKYIGTKLRMPINNVLDIPAKHYSRALEIINTRSQKVQEKTAGAK